VPVFLVLIAGVWWTQRQPAAVPSSPQPEPAGEIARTLPVAATIPAAASAEATPPSPAAAPATDTPAATPPAEPPPAEPSALKPPTRAVIAKTEPQAARPQITPPPKPSKVPRIEPLSAVESASLAALNEVMRLWRPRSGSAERRDLDDLPAWFASRGLQLLPFTGDLRQLLRLNSPALLELSAVDGAVYWCAVVEQRANSWRVVPAAGNRELLTGRELQSLWTGRAWLPWDDIHEVGAAGDGSARIAKLQELLVSAGYRQEPADGHYDRATAKAIGRFQADHGLAVDGSAGVYTLVMLYQYAADARVPQLQRRSGG